MCDEETWVFKGCAMFWHLSKLWPECLIGAKEIPGICHNIPQYSAQRCCNTSQVPFNCKHATSIAPQSYVNWTCPEQEVLFFKDLHYNSTHNLESLMVMMVAVSHHSLVLKDMQNMTHDFILQHQTLHGNLQKLPDFPFWLRVWFLVTAALNAPQSHSAEDISITDTSPKAIIDHHGSGRSPGLQKQHCELCHRHDKVSKVQTFVRERKHSMDT